MLSPDARLHCSSVSPPFQSPAQHPDMKLSSSRVALAWEASASEAPTDLVNRTRIAQAREIRAISSCLLWKWPFSNATLPAARGDGLGITQGLPATRRAVRTVNRSNG